MAARNIFIEVKITGYDDVCQTVLGNSSFKYVSQLLDAISAKDDKEFIEIIMNKLYL